MWQNTQAWAEGRHQEIANSNEDQHQEVKVRGDVIAQEERRLVKCKAEKARSDALLKLSTLDKGK